MNFSLKCLPLLDIFYFETLRLFFLKCYNFFVFQILPGSLLKLPCARRVGDLWWSTWKCEWRCFVVTHQFFSPAALWTPDMDVSWRPVGLGWSHYSGVNYPMKRLFSGLSKKNQRWFVVVRRVSSQWPCPVSAAVWDPGQDSVRFSETGGGGNRPTAGWAGLHCCLPAAWGELLTIILNLNPNLTLVLTPGLRWQWDTKTLPRHCEL